MSEKMEWENERLRAENEQLREASIELLEQLCFWNSALPNHKPPPGIMNAMQLLENAVKRTNTQEE